MDEFIRVGVDLGKGYFQIHALTGAAAVSRKLSRPKVRTFFARLAPAASAWRLADRPIIGRASLPRWGTRSC